jgi:hypothetical protein
MQLIKKEQKEGKRTAASIMTTLTFFFCSSVFCHCTVLLFINMFFLSALFRLQPKEYPTIVVRSDSDF